MNCSFKVERWAEFVHDAKPIFPVHYAELALDQDKIKLDLDFDRYEEMDAAGMLHIVTVRFGPQLVGYWIGMVVPHLHYGNAGPMCWTDIYFLLPEFRKGGCGAKLLIEVECTLKARGVVKAYLSTKVHQDHSELFSKLGWKLSDKVFTKVL